MRVDKFKPETYFSRTDYLEFSMAKAIYHENKKQIKENVSSGKVDINKPGVSGFTYLLYAIFLERYDIVKGSIGTWSRPKSIINNKTP